jgi:hypothetical protein
VRLCLLASVPHTGTNWLLAFWRNHPTITHLVELTALAKTASLRRRSLSADHFDSGLRPESCNLVWGHFHEKEKALLFGLATAWPAVVPVRDPLLSLCSRRARQPSEDDLGRMFEAWRLWVAFDDWEPAYVPVDLPNHNALVAAAMLFATPMVPSQIEAQETREPLNSQGAYPLRNAYDAGDREVVRVGLGPAVYTRLRNMEGELRPILERVGYRDLMWWTR